MQQFDDVQHTPDEGERYRQTGVGAPHQDPVDEIWSQHAVSLFPVWDAGLERALFQIVQRQHDQLAALDLHDQRGIEVILSRLAEMHGAVVCLEGLLA